MHTSAHKEVTTMKTLQSISRAGFATVFALLAMVEVAWAQTTFSGQVNTPGSGTPGGGHYGFLAFLFVVGLLVLVGVAVKLFDVKRKREDEGVALQSRLSDALLTDPSFAGLPITPTVHVPFSRSAPAVIRLTGTVPSPWTREAALELIRREAASLMGNTRIEDRLVVDPLIMRRAA
jgi:hypothetical protein